MNQRSSTHIVAFVGLPGAGKSSAVDFITEQGYPKVYFGGVVLDALADAGIDQTVETERYMREKLRADEGNDVIVNRIIKQINRLIAAGQRRIVVDGLYSWTEYKAMKRAFPGELTVVAIVAPRILRHRRLTQRPIRPLTVHQASTRDWAEIETLEKGGPIAIADHFIINDRNLEALHREIDTILRDVSFYDERDLEK